MKDTAGRRKTRKGIENGEMQRDEGASGSQTRREACVKKPKTGNHSCTLTTAAGDISFNPMPTDRVDAAALSLAQLRPVCECRGCKFPCCFRLHIVCSGLAEHCGHLILATVETMEYCWRGKEAGDGRVRLSRTHFVPEMKERLFLILV